MWKEIQVPLGKDLQGPAFNLWCEDKGRVVVEIKSMERRLLLLALETGSPSVAWNIGAPHWLNI